MIHFTWIPIGGGGKCPLPPPPLNETLMLHCYTPVSNASLSYDVTQVCRVCALESSSLWCDDLHLYLARACVIEPVCMHNAILGKVNRHGWSKNRTSTVRGLCLEAKKRGFINSLKTLTARCDTRNLSALCDLWTMTTRLTTLPLVDVRRLKTVLTRLQDKAKERFDNCHRHHVNMNGIYKETRFTYAFLERVLIYIINKWSTQGNFLTLLIRYCFHHF